MKIAYNPKTAAVITTATAVNDDILFDLNAKKVWAKGLRMGADWADISSKPSSLKNPYSLTTFGVVYDGSAAKVVSPSNFISLLEEVTGVVTDGTMFITSWASNSGFADTNAVNVPYKRKAIHLWEYIKAKTDSIYATKGHNHDDRYLKLTGGTMSGILSFSPNDSTDASPKIYSTVSDALTSLNFEVSDDTTDRFVFKINCYEDTNTTNRERFTIDWNNVISKAPITAPSFNGNATSATKLQTPRTIWGQSFDGTGNVSGNMSGVGLITFSALSETNGRALLYLQMADNDYFRIYTGGTTSNSGYVEIATADDGNEPIYVRQYTGTFSTIKRTLTLLDGSGNTIFPGSLSIGGNIIFPNSSHLLWNSGSWYLRILLTDDSTADTAVFTFLQSSDSGTNWSNLMTIRDNGKVIANTFVGALLGNASTASKLQTTRTLWGQPFNGTTNVDGTINISGTSGNYNQGIRIHTFTNSALSSIWFRATNTDGYQAGMWGISVDDNGMRFRGNTSKTATSDPIDYMNILHGGNVGIGTTNPSSKLTINGDISLFNVGSIRNLAIGGGIYWDPRAESTTDSSDAASITLVRLGVAGGTTLVFSLLNDANDTILFKTNNNARLYHNSYPILTTLNTYVSNSKGYINGTEITLVNNADTVDNRHAISTTPNTGIIYKAAIYTSSSLTSYWVRLASISGITLNEEFIATIHVLSGHSNPGRSAILLVYLRGGVSSFMSKSFKICCNSNYDPNRFRLYYKDSDKTSEIWYQTTGLWDGIITTVISLSSEGSLYEGLTLYSGRITAVQTPSMSTYLSALVSTITDNISGNASTATKLQTARTIWGQSFDGTKDINGSIVFPNIEDTAISSKISWSGSTDGADIYYLTTGKDLGNLVLNVKDDANAYILLALNGVFKSHFDVANSYWTGRSALADKWTTARTFTIGNTAKNVDGSGNVSWSLAEIGVNDTWRAVQVNGTSIGNNTLNLCGSTYIGLTNVNGKVTFSLVGSGTTANQAILSNGTANGWTLKTLNIANWDTAYNFVSTITGEDTDKVINKWDEIVNFLAGITEDNKLNTLLNSKLSILLLSAKEVLTTKTNNALYWVNTKGTASSITTGPFTDHPYALLSVTNYNLNAENNKFFYRSRLAFSSSGDIKVASCHYENEYKLDETWYNVLTSKNSGINGSTIKLNGTSITVYSSSTADGRYVKKSGDTMSGVLTIDTTNFGALVIKRNDDANGASIQFRGKSSVYGYIGLNNSTKDKLFLRWNSDTSKTYTILDTSSTYTSNGKGVINGTTITQVDNATNSTNSTNARKLVNWYSARPTSLNTQFGDGSLRIFYATSSTTEGKPAEDSPILHLAWDNNGGFDAQLAVHTRSGKVSTRAQNGGTWQPWKTLAFTTDIPTSLKNPHSLTLKANGTILATYDGSSAKEANFTYANVGAASASHTHSYITISTCSSLNGNSNNFSVEYAGGSNSVATKPSGVDAFGVIRLRTAAGWYGQIMMSANTAPGIYYRNANGLTSSVNWIKLLDSSNSNVSGGGNTWGSSITVNINGTSKTLTIPNNPNTDYRVTQSETTTANYRPLVVGYTNVSTAGSGMTGSVTNQVYLSNKFYVQPSTGNLYATNFVGALSGNATTATNADKVDGYHASGLWRSDGATWNPGANVSLNASANGQEWSFDIRRNGYTGCYWHVWDSTLSTLLKVNADNGKVYAPYNFVGNLEGNASTATALTTSAGSATLPIYFSGGKPIACTASLVFSNLSNSGNNISVTVAGLNRTLTVGYATSAGSATKVIVNLHTTNDTNYPLVWSNLNNTNNATENQLYKSWLDLYYNPKNKRLFVKGSVSTANINATGTVTSAGFKHSGVTKNADLYVLTADGSYTFLNLTSNELAHEFSKDITVTSEWADIEDFYGGNLNFLTLPGTYIVLVYYTTNSANSMYEGYFSGIMSWYTGTTNSNNADEIVLHRVGHAYANTIYLRTRESLKDDPHPYTKLQISANSDLKQHTYKFKFKRIC